MGCSYDLGSIHIAVLHTTCHTSLACLAALPRAASSLRAISVQSSCHTSAARQCRGSASTEHRGSSGCAAGRQGPAGARHAGQPAAAAARARLGQQRCLAVAGPGWRPVPGRSDRAVARRWPPLPTRGVRVDVAACIMSGRTLPRRMHALRTCARLQRCPCRGRDGAGPAAATAARRDACRRGGPRAARPLRPPPDRAPCTCSRWRPRRSRRPSRGARRRLRPRARAHHGAAQTAAAAWRSCSPSGALYWKL